MDLSRLLRTLSRRAVTDPIGALRLVTIRVRDEPAHVLLRALGLLPVGPRHRAAGVLGRLGGLLAVIAPRAGWPVLCRLAAMDARGQRAEAVALARRLGPSRSARGRLVLAGWLAEVEHARDALLLVEPLPATPRVQRVRGRIRWRAGDWRAAREELAAAAASDGQPTTRRTLHRVAEDLRAVEPDLPAGPDAAVGDRAPVEVAWRAHTRAGAAPGRVVHLINNSLPWVQAGYTVRAQRVARAQQEHGIDPVMVTKLGFPWRQGQGDAAPHGQVDGVRYVHVPDPGGDTVFGTAERVDRAIDRVGAAVAGLRPALLHPTTPFDNAQVALAIAEVLEVPVVYEVRGFLEETWVSRHADAGPEAVAAALASDRYRLTRATEARCAAAAGHVVTLGEAMKADLVERGVDAQRITVVPNAVDLDAFTRSPGGERGRGVRRHLEVPDQRVLLGYVSSLVAYEGVEVLLRATRLLLDRGADVSLVIVGDGTARAEWEREAAALGLDASRCRFTGRVPHHEVAGYYEAIDVFVVPRRNERVCRLVTPIKPVEAMALEGCVVVSDLPALAEMVEEGVTGRTFPAEDPEALAEVVAPLLEDPSARAALGRAARERVAAQRTWTQNGRRYAEIYRDLGLEVH